jgi:phosphate transport system permease protein
MPLAGTSITSSELNAPIDLRKRSRPGEAIIRALLLASALVSILTTAGIVLVLIFDAIKFFARPEPTLLEFFTGTVWQPQILKFGIFPLLNATIVSSLIGMAVALPLGLMIAIYLSEYASARARGVLKPTLEILAGIPTVVFGFFALGFMTPLLQGIFGKDNVEVFNVASAGIVIGILIIPLVSSMSEDALSAVPRALREASYGIGATRLETAVKVVVPAALSGISAAFIVAMSRAVGETMVVAIAAGAGPRNFNSWGDALGGLNFLNPFKAAETMTGHIVRISGGDLSYESIDYDSIFAIAFLLFIITLILNLISRWVVRRFRQEY